MEKFVWTEISSKPNKSLPEGVSYVFDENRLRIDIKEGVDSHVYLLDTKMGGDIIIDGKGNGNARRNGEGNGNARRSGEGNGYAWRDGKGNGDARRDGKGRGYARRDGKGKGEAYHNGKLIRCVSFVRDDSDPNQKNYKFRVYETGLITAGCRVFRTLADAEAHWGDNDYRDKNLGQWTIEKIRKSIEELK